MPTPLDTLRAAYADPYAAARAHRAAGGKVVGYFLNSVPAELIVAAGWFPVRLRGDPQLRSPLAEKYLEDYMDGEVRSIFGALLEGRFDFADLIVIPRNSEVYLQLYYFLLEMPRWETETRTPPIHLFDLLQTPSSTTLRYVVGRLHALAERLGGVTAAALTAAITATNQQRLLLQQVSKLWHTDSVLSGVDALTTISAASFMHREEFVSAVSELIAHPPPRPARSGPRILVKGSPQADARFTALIERVGARVVAHDHLWGDRTYETLIPERSEPWAALARHYCLDIPSPREYPQTKADERFLALAMRAQIDGVVFHHDEWDDTLGWEYPDQKKLLDEHGIASLFLKRQAYFEPNEVEQERSVRAFIEQLQARA